MKTAESDSTYRLVLSLKRKQSTVNVTRETEKRKQITFNVD